MRTSREVYHQILWDPRLQAGDYLLEYRERGGSTREIALIDFVPEGDIPWHRVWRIRGPQGPIWDRQQGLDSLRASGPAPSPTLPTALTVLTWNLMASEREGDRYRRIGPLLEVISRQQADLVALQEVSPDLPIELEGLRRLGSGSVVLACRQPPRQVLHQAERSLVVELESGLRVAAAHFTSDRQPRAVQKRRTQWEELSAHLGAGPALVLGDLNAEPEEVTSWPLEGFELAHRGPTFGPVRQLDHVLVRGALPHRRSSLLESDGSDHCGLVVRLQAEESLTRQTALVVVPPRELWPPLERWKRPDRWMPHLTLRFGFVPEEAFEQEAAWLEARLADFEPFELTLDRVGSFNESVWWIGPSDPEPMQRLQEQVGGAPGVPHLTVARGRRPPELSQLVPISFRVESVHMLAGQPLSSRRSLALKPPTPPTWLNRACQTVAPGKLWLVGSQALGLESEDCDAVYSTSLPAEPLLTRVQSQLGRGRLALGARVPRLEVDGVDLTTDASALLHTRALLQAVDRRFCLPRARRQWAEVRAWARQEGLYGQAFGYPGGLAWSLLVAAWLLRAPEREFRAFVAGWPWPEPLALDEVSYRPRASELMPILTPEPVQNAARAVFPSTRMALLRSLRGEREPAWERRLVLRWSQPDDLGRVLGFLLALEEQGAELRPRPQKDHLVLDLRGRVELPESPFLLG